MSLSNDDEDEFQSADEDGFDEDLKEDIAAQAKQADQPGPVKLEDVNKQVDESVKAAAEEPQIRQTSSQKLERCPSLSDIEDSKMNLTPNVEYEEDNEEAIAERIRERNIKIARKFSAELAKSVKASAPIPVKTEPPIGFRVDDIEYPDLPDSDKKSVRQPQAPPPTPALSSSFCADEPLASPASSAAAAVPGETSGTQYGWRVPIKPRTKQTDIAPPKECDINQARAALDRLSEKYTDADKSLFQKVADDIKKVTIKSDDPPIDPTQQQSTSSGSSGLPSISSLGQSFGGWNWNSASRILASASEVTAQVSSVLDSVVNAPRNAAPAQPGSSDQTPPAAPQLGANPTPSSSNNQSGNKASMSASEAMSNDALVDLTLNAMESLGKKAFGAITHRDETGSLQIKGLGRPWDQLLNIKKPQVEQPSGEDDNRFQGHQSSTETTTIPADSTRVAVDSDKSEQSKSSVRRRVAKFDDSDTLD